MFYWCKPNISWGAVCQCVSSKLQSSVFCQFADHMKTKTTPVSEIPQIVLGHQLVAIMELQLQKITVISSMPIYFFLLTLLERTVSSDSV